jgi:hypothetical protein
MCRASARLTPRARGHRGPAPCRMSVRTRRTRQGKRGLRLLASGRRQEPRRACRPCGSRFDTRQGVRPRRQAVGSAGIGPCPARRPVREESSPLFIVLAVHDSRGVGVTFALLAPVGGVRRERRWVSRQRSEGRARRARHGMATRDALSVGTSGLRARDRAGYLAGAAWGISMAVSARAARRPAALGSLKCASSICARFDKPYSAARRESAPRTSGTTTPLAHLWTVVRFTPRSSARCPVPPTARARSPRARGSLTVPPRLGRLESARFACLFGVRRPRSALRPWAVKSDSLCSAAMRSSRIRAVRGGAAFAQRCRVRAETPNRALSAAVPPTARASSPTGPGNSTGRPMMEEGALRFRMSLRGWQCSEPVDPMGSRLTGQVGIKRRDLARRAGHARRRVAKYARRNWATAYHLGCERMA